MAQQHDPRPPPGSEPNEHYRRGNRFFERRAWDEALAEWRQATALWHPPHSRSDTRRRSWRLLPGVLLFVLTVLLAYQLIFVLFPRDDFTITVAGFPGQQPRSWWEQFLDAGRPQDSRPGQRMGIREWWEHWRRNFGRSEGERRTAQGGGRPTIDERWADLLRRYGRWGPLQHRDLDYSVVAGHGLTRQGDFEAAVEVLQQGVERTTDPKKLGDLYQELANAYYYRGYRLQPDGLALYDLKLVKRAAEAYEQSLANDPRLIAYGNLGWMYFLLADYEKAEDFSRRSLTFNPGLHYVRLNLGLVYLVQDRVHEAFEAYRTVINANPPGEVYLGGINDLREVLRDNPGRYPYAHLMIGLLSLKQGEFANARRSLERFSSDPRVRSTWRDLAERLLENLGRLERER